LGKFTNGIGDIHNDRNEVNVSFSLIPFSLVGQEAGGGGVARTQGVAGAPGSTSHRRGERRTDRTIRAWPLPVFGDASQSGAVRSRSRKRLPRPGGGSELVLLPARCPRSAVFLYFAPLAAWHFEFAVFRGVPPDFTS
jgi:hypothetical protein